MIMLEIERSIVPPLNRRRGKKRHEAIGNADRPGARTSSPVRSGECFVQIGVNDVDPHVAGACHTDESIQVRAITVEVRTFAMENLGHLPDLGLKDA